MYLLRHTHYGRLAQLARATRLHRVGQRFESSIAHSMITFGIAGLLLAAYGLWIKNEKIQDIIYIIGGIFLLTYSIYIDDPVFIVLQVVFIFSALFELIKLSKK